MHQQTAINLSQKTRGFLLLASLVASSLTIGGHPASAQPLPPAAGVVAPGYNSSFSGTVERYLLNREGVVDGLLLKNGLQVKFPPHMASSLSAAVKPGNTVTVTGSPGLPTQLGQEVRAYSITNTQSQSTVVDQPPVYPPQPPVSSGYENLSATGTAQHWLVGGRGEVKGIVLSNGTQVKFPPHVGYQLTNLARRGARIQAQGFGSRSSYGTILEATSLSVDGQTIAVSAYPPAEPLARPR